MKKYLTAFAAVIVAISLSAFSLPKKGNADNTTYWWYELNLAKTHTEGSAVNSVELSKADIIYEYVVCEDDEGQPNCLAGFEDPVTSPQSISGLGENELVRHTQ